MIIEEAGDARGSKIGVVKTEDWLGCPLLVGGYVCRGGGPLIKLLVMRCLWYVADRGCGGVSCRWAKFVGFGCLRDLGAPLREPMCSCVCLGDL